eukprot:TRINITY_DN49494_c0_g1_i1.p1 TRINITY_DN49494_c0_g1~~TRINITY_DN49494_c0_g1_i1.p1  ORF type:complete len:679 (+),score=217.89 TRINITY_DN49494_c0_g1_i1:122-2158(+)
MWSPAARALLLSWGLSASTVLALENSEANTRVINRHTQHAKSGNPISGVVKMLQDMAAKSEAEGSAEEETFGKFECYATKTLKAKAKEIEELTNEVKSLENKIEKEQALGNSVAAKKGALEADIKKTEDAMKVADAERASNKEHFTKEETDLTTSLATIDKAMGTLGSTGGAALLQTGVPDATLAAVAAQLQKASGKKFLTSKDKSSSDGVIGILKGTKGSYETNLEQLRTTEKTEVEVHEKFTQTNTDKITTLGTMVEEAQSTMADTAKSIGEKKERLDTAKETLDTATAFRDELDKDYQKKKGIYEKRSKLRSGEDAAIAKAIAVLNSDAAFANFESQKASFAQISSSSRPSSEVSRHPTMMLLMEESRKLKSARLAKAAVLLSQPGPLDKVIQEISNMQRRIGREAGADKKQFDWCASERKKNTESIEKATSDIGSLTDSISELQKSLDGPEDGLKVTLATAKANLKENEEDQTTATKNREAENAAYKKNTATLQQAQRMITKATEVLQKYYKHMKETDVTALVQKEDPPDYEETTYKGSEAGETVIKMMETVNADTKKEEDEAHADEKEAQTDYEDSKTKAIEEANTLKKLIETTENDIAETTLDMNNKKADKGETEKQKQSHEDYLLSIKEGCDFIAENYDKREAARLAESNGLDAAVEKLKASPVFQKQALK